MSVQKRQQGSIIMAVLIYASLSVLVTSALISWLGTQIKTEKRLRNKEQAIEIAESGINYYRWHLAHVPSDYTDGASSSGPYIHPYYDRDGNKIGAFSLSIIPPPTGSTMVTITATGTVLADPTVTRTIQVKLAKPSLAKFSVFANDAMRFGEGTEVFGPIHSNGGVHFDGLAHNVITSAVSTYNDPDYNEPNVFGVYTRLTPKDPYPPAAVPSRNDVFAAGRQFPVAPVDFTGLTQSISTMKTSAQSGGRYIAPSGSQGYHVVLKTNGTFDLYKVTKLNNPPNQCGNDLNETGWGTWTIASNGQTFLANYSNPTNGILFIEDNLWIDGQASGTTRMTVVAARFPIPATLPDITVNADLLYKDYTGKDALSLIAQGDFNVGLTSDDSLRIDGAIVAQNGRVGRYYYASDCGTGYIRNDLTLYGMIGTNQRYGFAFTDGTGYVNRTIIYDSNLLYAPPPSFPLTTDQYQMVSWQEVTK